MPRSHLLLAAAFVPLSLSAVLAQDAVADYLNRYDGTWSGGGSVILEKLPEPANVDCDVTGNSNGGTSFSLSGSCNALLIFSRDIGAELTYDPASETYSGVYTGSSSGPAQLVGKRNGDALELDVTWGRQIYNDNKARMRIENAGGDAFRLVVTDEVDGQSVEVSNLTFERA